MLTELNKKKKESVMQIKSFKKRRSLESTHEIETAFKHAFYGLCFKNRLFLKCIKISFPIAI
jgi:hypothetical protein